MKLAAAVVSTAAALLSSCVVTTTIGPFLADPDLAVERAAARWEAATGVRRPAPVVRGALGPIECGKSKTAGGCYTGATKVLQIRVDTSQLQCDALALHEMGHHLGFMGHHNDTQGAAMSKSAELFACITPQDIEKICLANDCTKEIPECTPSDPQ